MTAATLGSFVVPGIYALASLVPDRMLGADQAIAEARRWRLALAISLLAPFATFAVAFGDALTLLMLLLVTTIAAVILRYSRRYWQGEPGQARFVRAFQATLAAVTLLVVTTNLLVLALAWTATSMALHQLLTFYQERSEALVAAHKKFLMSRLADVAIFSAVALVFRAFGTLDIASITAQAEALANVPTSLEIAGTLLVIGVALRSAQVPFHGWLIQVMEAPTPVSALLHAGIINIGGFVMIRLGGLMVHLEMAQTLLVVLGTMTAVLAGLVMMTRVSIKVALAWSTAAQMGFMALECGLGAYHLALLHLLAHSMYKAHAFLSSGRAVEQELQRAMTPASRPPHAVVWAASGIAGVLMVGLSGAGLAMAGWETPHDAGTLVSLLVLSLALAPLFARAWMTHKWTEKMTPLLIALGLVALDAAWNALFHARVAVGGVEPLPLGRIAWVATSFTVLFVIQGVVRTAPNGATARALYPWAFAGFYVDEVFTRLTFKLWPPRRPRTKRPVPLQVVTLEPS